MSDRRPLNESPLQEMTAGLLEWLNSEAGKQEMREVFEQIAAANARPQQRQRDRLRILPYDGSRSWSVFEAQFTSAAVANGWTESECRGRLLNALRGAAADLVQTLPPSEYLNYEALRARLREHFDSPQRSRAQRRALAEVELDRRAQRSGESLSTFGAEVLKLARLAYPTWADAAVQTMACKVFLAGIANADVRRAARLRQPKDLQEAIAAALHAETVGSPEPAAK